MNIRVKKGIITFLLMCLEFYMIYVHKDDLIGIITYLAQTSENFFDDIFVSLVGTVFFSLIQLINVLIVDALLLFSKKTVVVAMQYIFRYNDSSILDAVSQVIKFALSTKCKWGVTKNTAVLKNANTAEGLIAFADAIQTGIELTNHQTEEIKKVLNYQIGILKEDGYESFNENVCTVHCTGMMLYAIKRFVDIGLIELTDDEEDKIRFCLKKLLNNANAQGWGFINQRYTDTTYNRSLSTLWALRALNAWGFSEKRSFCEILNNLVTPGKGRIGFSVNTVDKYSATAMLCLVVHELKNEKLRSELLKLFDRKALLKYLIKGLNTETEVEEFITDSINERKLPWTHFTECYVMQALTLFFKDMSYAQILKLSVGVRQMTKKIDSNQHFYLVSSMNFRPDDPFFYPSTYLISALCKVCSSLRNNGLE